MNIFWIILSILLCLAVVFFATVFVIFMLVFYSKTRTKAYHEKYKLPPGKVYEQYKDSMIQSMKEYRQRKYEAVSIKTFDGLVLQGRYFEYKKGAPIELMMHGYRGNSETDMAIGVKRCFEMGRNALLVDHRGAGYSEGHIITFGAKESRDCLEWINFIIDKFGSDQKILLAGMSMGAATVLIAAGKDLPKNVVGVIADCGYTSAEEIIKKIVKQLHLPVSVTYPLIKLGAKLFGGFDLDEASPIKSLKNCKIPVAFIHGDTDGFVPCEMSVKNYEVCPSKKYLYIVKGADHGLSYMLDKQGYKDTLAKHAKACGI